MLFDFPGTPVAANDLFIIQGAPQGSVLSPSLFKKKKKLIKMHI